MHFSLCTVQFAMGLSNPLHGERKLGFVGYPLKGVKVQKQARLPGVPACNASLLGLAPVACLARLTHLAASQACQGLCASPSFATLVGKRSGLRVFALLFCGVHVLQTKVVYSESGEPATEDGEAEEGEGGGKDKGGELLVRSPGMFREYWKRPEANAEAFDEEGFFKTGDTVAQDADGCFKILGREWTCSLFCLSLGLLLHRSWGEVLSSVWGSREDMGMFPFSLFWPLLRRTVVTGYLQRQLTAGLAHLRERGLKMCSVCAACGIFFARCLVLAMQALAWTS